MKTFEEKLKSMTAKDLVLAMVEGLEKEWVKVDMGSYGFTSESGICFGCAATNTICQINGVAFDGLSICSLEDRADFVHGDLEVLNSFEAAVNALREGSLQEYNIWIDILDIPCLKIPVSLEDQYLPYLGSITYKGKLQAYRDFANLL